MNELYDLESGRYYYYRQSSSADPFRKWASRAAKVAHVIKKASHYIPSNFEHSFASNLKMPKRRHSEPTDEHTRFRKVPKLGESNNDLSARPMGHLARTQNDWRDDSMASLAPGYSRKRALRTLPKLNTRGMHRKSGGFKRGRTGVRKRKSAKIVGKGGAPYGGKTTSKAAVVSKRKSEKHKKVYVPKRLRKQIGEIFKSGTMHGTFHSVWTGNSMFATTDNLSTVYDDGNSENPYPHLFTLEQFQNELSMLFNGRSPLIDPTTISNYVPNYVTNFNFSTLKYRLKSSFVKYLVKNNTQRNLTIRMYVCAPKKNWPWSILSPTNVTQQTDISGANATTVPDALRTLTQQILKYYNDDNTSASYKGDAATATNWPLFWKPTILPSFRKDFSIGEEVVVLQPGQEHSFFVKGPSNIDIDLAKCFTETFFNGYRKHSRSVIFSVTNDITTTSLSTAGRWSSATNLYGVAIEKQTYNSYSMPEETGGIAVAATNPMSLQYRKPVACHLSFVAAKSGATEEIVVENPLTVIAPAS